MTNKLIIIPNTDYTARAVKIGSFNPPTLGYSFSYPVLNTPEICNLLITSGEILIKIERSGPTTWKFNKETSELSILKPKSDTPDISVIQDVQELHEKMTVYFYENYDILMKKSKQAVKVKGTPHKEIEKENTASPTFPVEENTLSQDELYQKIYNSITEKIDCRTIDTYPEIKNLDETALANLLKADKITRGAFARLKFKNDDDIKFYNKMEYNDKLCFVLTSDEKAYFESIITRKHLESPYGV